MVAAVISSTSRSRADQRNSYFSSRKVRSTRFESEEIIRIPARDPVLVSALEQIERAVLRGLHDLGWLLLRLFLLAAAHEQD